MKIRFPTILNNYFVQTVGLFWRAFFLYMCQPVYQTMHYMSCVNMVECSNLWPSSWFSQHPARCSSSFFPAHTPPVSRTSAAEPRDHWSSAPLQQGRKWTDRGGKKKLYICFYIESNMYCLCSIFHFHFYLVTKVITFTVCNYRRTHTTFNRMTMDVSEGSKHEILRRVNISSFPS